MGVGNEFLGLSLQTLVVVLAVPHKPQHVLNAGFEDLTIDLQRPQIFLLGKISRQEPLVLHLFPFSAVSIDIHFQDVLTIGRQDGLTQFVPLFLGSYQGGKLLQPRQVLLRLQIHGDGGVHLSQLTGKLLILALEVLEQR